jgi:ABC-type nickel/cobalt efflux system permease component RcnA
MSDDPDFESGPAADQYLAFMRDLSRLERERSALLDGRAQGRLSKEEQARLKILDEQIKELLEQAGHQHIILPLAERLSKERRKSAITSIAIAGAIVAVAALTSVALGLGLTLLGVIPVFVLALGFAFVLGFLIGREFPYKK